LPRFDVFLTRSLNQNVQIALLPPDLGHADSLPWQYEAGVCKHCGECRCSTEANEERKTGSRRETQLVFRYEEAVVLENEGTIEERRRSWSGTRQHDHDVDLNEINGWNKRRL
jgi:hypothetical protein